MSKVICANLEQNINTKNLEKNSYFFLSYLIIITFIISIIEFVQFFFTFKIEQTTKTTFIIFFILSFSIKNYIDILFYSLFFIFPQFSSSSFSSSILHSKPLVPT